MHTAAKTAPGSVPARAHPINAPDDRTCRRPGDGLPAVRGTGAVYQRPLPAAWYCSATLAGMRPRSLTARPCSESSLVAGVGLVHLGGELWRG